MNPPTVVPAPTHAGTGGPVVAEDGLLYAMGKNVPLVTGEPYKKSKQPVPPDIGNVGTYNFRLVACCGIEKLDELEFPQAIEIT